MPTVHLVTMDRFPLTLCGVDTNLKTGALWTDEDDLESVTCKNCLKLKNGGQMGAPPPTAQEKRGREEAKKDPEIERKLPFWARLNRLEEVQIKIGSLLMTCRAIVGDSLVVEEVGELAAMQEYVEAANFRLSNAMAMVRYEMEHPAQSE